MKRIALTITVICLSVAFLLLTVAVVQADANLLWQSDGLPVSIQSFSQDNPSTVPDGYGGALIAWEDNRSGISFDIFAQRVDWSGHVLWATNGVTVSNAINDQRYPQVVSDGAGGAIIVWQDKRNGSDYNIFAQRISAMGVPLWNRNGITICLATDLQNYARVVSDDNGGVIITWEDKRSGNYDINAQHISANGTILWTTNGVHLNESQQFSPYPEMVSDGHSGLIVAWQHNSPDQVHTYIFAQRIISTGVPSWQTPGITISLNEGAFPHVIPDGSGGAILAWGSASFYTQRISSLGNLLWGTNGKTINVSYGANIELATDDQQGAYMAWQIYSNSYSNSEIRAQHVLSDGTRVWAANGISISTPSGYQYIPQIVKDGYHGAILLWKDDPTVDSDPTTDDSLYAQRIDQLGTRLWMTDGLTVITGTGNGDIRLATDTLNGAIAVWQDLRNDASDLYAQHISDLMLSEKTYLPLVLK